MTDIVEKLRSLATEWHEMCDDIHVPLSEAADEIERLNARLAAINAFAGTLAVHVEGHFVMPDANSEAICKRWAKEVLDWQKENRS